jgi:hypothetical protein
VLRKRFNIDNYIEVSRIKVPNEFDLIFNKGYVEYKCQVDQIQLSPGEMMYFLLLLNNFTASSYPGELKIDVDNNFKIVYSRIKSINYFNYFDLTAFIKASKLESEQVNKLCKEFKTKFLSQIKTSMPTLNNQKPYSKAEQEQEQDRSANFNSLEEIFRMTEDDEEGNNKDAD